MKIKKLEIRNALGIKELSLEPGKTTVISGGSEKGKTSILDAIRKALDNSCPRAQFVMKGENEAFIHMSVEPDIDITRKIREGKTDAVKVMQGNSVVSKPESFLKGLINSYAFNPVTFMSHTDREQTDILLKLIPLELDSDMITSWFGELPACGFSGHGLTALKQIEQFYYNLRRELNRELKNAELQLATSTGKLPVNYDPKQWENVSLQEKYQAITAIESAKRAVEENREIINKGDAEKKEINEKFQERISRLDAELSADTEKLKSDAEKEKSTLQLEISELKQKIADREAKLESIDKVTETKISSVKATHETAKKQVESSKNERLHDIENKIIQADTFLKQVGTFEDVEKLKEEAAHIEEMKGFIPYYRDVQELKKKLDKLRAQSLNFDTKIETARRKPAELLSGMEMPVTGLGINDEFQITIDELPIKNLSTSRQIKLALEIARATAGKLKIICIDQFETLDTDRRTEFLKEIENDDFQYFITQVTNGELSIKSDVDKEMTA